MAGIYTNIMETAERITAKQTGGNNENEKTEAVKIINSIDNSETYKNFSGGWSGGGWVGALIGAGSGKSTTYENPNETNKNTLLVVAVVAVVLLFLIKK